MRDEQKNRDPERAGNGRPRSGDAANLSDEEIGQMYRAHTETPAAPVEEMWSVIATQLPARGGGSTLEFPVRRTAVRMIGWAMAAGIVLAVGIGIGRSSVGPGVQTPVAESPSDDGVPTRPLSARRVVVRVTDPVKDVRMVRPEFLPQRPARRELGPRRREAQPGDLFLLRRLHQLAEEANR